MKLRRRRNGQIPILRTPRRRSRSRKAIRRTRNSETRLPVSVEGVSERIRNSKFGKNFNKNEVIEEIIDVKEETIFTFFSSQESKSPKKVKKL